MPRTEIEAQIRASVDSFVDELSDLIRHSALRAVEDALGSSSGSGAPRGRSGATRKKKAVRRMKESGKRIRRSPEALEQAGEQLMAHIRANPGARLEEIAAEFGSTSKELRQPIKQMLSEDRLKTEGKARGMRYFARGAGAGASKKNRKKKAGKRRKKATRRKKKAA